jgi:uncharacterized protein DUF6600
MPVLHPRRMKFRPAAFVFLMCFAAAASLRAQVAQPPAYLVFVQGNATIERDGEIMPATMNMPFVPGDRLRTANGRVQIAFPDGTAIELAEDSEVECITPSRVRLLAGTMDHVQLPVPRSQSGMYLPHELDVYGQTLDENGSWQYDTSYGYVWYPAVATDWRPYYYGYWSPVRSYGLTWIGLDAWTWPTYHYGRWGYTRDRWFWIPGRTWGPAWVSWGSAPGYVSWCPLGFNGRPVFALPSGSGTAWRGWTVVPRTNFGVHGYYANQFAVDARRLPASTPFIVRNVAPSVDVRNGRGTFDNGRTASQQSPVANRPAAAGRRPTTAVGAGRRPSQGPPSSTAVARPLTPIGATVNSAQGQEQSPVANQPTAGRQLPVELHRQSPDGRRFPAGDGRIPMHYGIAVPRTPMTAAPVPTPMPAPAGAPNSAPAYQPSMPGYRSPSDYRIERAEPRVTAQPAERSAMPVPRSNPGPAEHATPPPRTAPPAGNAPQGQGGGRAASPGRPR